MSGVLLKVKNMKILEITKTDTYAHPSVGQPHISVKKGETIELEDSVADIILSYGGGRIADSVDSPDRTITDEDDKEGSGWAGDVAEAMAESNKAKVLKAACIENNLDATGNKTELANRLVSAGVTEINVED